MNGKRPWLAHIGWNTDDENKGGSGGSSGGSTPPRTLEDVLKEHPHLAGELDTRTSNIATREKEQGKRSALAEWAKGLGVEDPNIVADVFRRYSEEQAAKMTDAERAQQEAEKAKQEAQALLAQAKDERFKAAAIRHLTQAGAADAEIAAAALGTLGVTADSDDNAIKTAVEQLKQRIPGLFAGQQGGTPGTGGAGTPPAGSPGGTGDPAGKPGQQAQSQIERLFGKQRTGGVQS